LFQLPLGSRIYSNLDPTYSWSNQEYLLADIAWVLRTLCWSLAGGKKTGQRQPERISPKERKVCLGKNKNKITDRETYQNFLNSKRGSKELMR
jgi:hypothetical protein